MAERTFVMVKPDGVQRGLVGTIVARLEARGLRLVAARLLQVDRELAERHYGVHEGKPFYSDLVSFITSGPVLATVWEGGGAISAVRATVGNTDPRAAAAGTIRGDLGSDISRNLIHASDSPETAAAEVSLFFGQDELLDYTRDVDAWIGPVDPSGS